MITSILYLVAGINLFTCLCLVAPLVTALAFGEGQWKIFLVSLLVTVIPSLLLLVIIKRDRIRITHRSGLAAAGISWFLTPLCAAVPFMLSGEIGGPTDCYFESVSGFTTTGSSILQTIEPISHAVLLWRALTQWLGGMGIVLVTVAFFSFLGVGATSLYQAEVPGLKDDKLFPRIATVARTLWLTYIILSVLEVLLLVLGGMTLFDAFCHMCTTMATGGFSTRTASIGAFGSAYLQWVIIAFMFIAGTNFSLHATVFSHRGLSYVRDSEFRFYLGVVLASTALICVSRLLSAPIERVELFVRESAFAVVSTITTTGFATCDYEQWAKVTHVPMMVMVTLMFVGGCGGSTGGGIKCIRILLLLKMAHREILRVIHPRALHNVRLQGRTVPDDALRATAALAFLWIAFAVVASLAVTLTGLDFVTAVTGVAATLNNVGPGFGTVGPAENFAHIPAAAKWVFIVCMIVGRLEIFTVFVLFFPSFWKK
jgi:trk system potassium uptake protein TrkH